MNKSPSTLREERQPVIGQYAVSAFGERAGLGKGDERLQALEGVEFGDDPMLWKIQES